VVASQSSSLPEVVGESGILLSPYQPEVWAHTISWLSGDSMAQQQLVERGRARAKLFSWVNTATAYQTLFRELTT
ncbi:MAG: glycosyl transferase, partial [Candidatus Veblenbacteria bacterium]|nr:glycosyl transferase [Candidatus Veblenbacteria bacterium]